MPTAARCVLDATKGLIAAFTNVLHTCKTAEVEFDRSATWPNRGKVGTVPTLQTWISQSSTNLDVVAPIKARACDALQAMLRSRAKAGVDSRVMRRGIERC